MPFEFVCPHCHCRTKVLDRYAGQSGPCVECGKQVAMPYFNSSGALVPSVQATKRAVRSTEPTQRSWMPAVVGASVVATLLLIGCSIFLVAWPGIQRSIRRVAQGRDLDNMRTIVEALNAYSDQYGTYPPPVVVDVTGKPLYSWRVLVLPFMGYEDIYKDFELTKAWDSTTNLA
jgi:hypothetical protein